MGRSEGLGVFLIWLVFDLVTFLLIKEDFFEIKEDFLRSRVLFSFCVSFSKDQDRTFNVEVTFLFSSSSFHFSQSAPLNFFARGFYFPIAFLSSKKKG